MSGSSVQKLFCDAAAQHPRAKKKRPAPLSIRLSDEEKARLKHEAGGGSVHALAKARLLASTPRVTPAVVDRRAIAQLLAKLGQSRLPSNMNQIAKAANSGSLSVSDHLCEELSRACADIQAMRLMLTTALGLKPKG